MRHLSTVVALAGLALAMSACSSGKKVSGPWGSFVLPANSSACVADGASEAPCEVPARAQLKAMLGYEPVLLGSWPSKSGDQIFAVVDAYDRSEPFEELTKRLGQGPRNLAAQSPGGVRVSRDEKYTSKAGHPAHVLHYVVSNSGGTILEHVGHVFDGPSARTSLTLLCHQRACDVVALSEFRAMTESLRLSGG